MDGGRGKRRLLTATGALTMAFALSITFGTTRIRAVDALADLDVGATPGLSALLSSARLNATVHGIAEFASVPTSRPRSRP